ncbi:MAG: DUF971 domain-containing protein [Leptospiraceae bacterium]|nr:DUF971 domain-containing protein [Leptospiraceae bacterium]
MLDTIPAEIHFDDEFLFIKWKDGFESKFDLLYLRKNCPCATCRGGDFGKIGTMTGNIQTAGLVAFRKVGRYALNLTWKDSHDTGIFTYDKLREFSDGRSKELHS